MIWILENAKILIIYYDIDMIDIGTFKGLQQIHQYFINDLYDFAGIIKRKYCKRKF